MLKNQVPVILHDLHDSPTAGHPGVEMAYQKMFQLYYFIGMQTIITDFRKVRHPLPKVQIHKLQTTWPTPDISLKPEE